MEDLDRFLETCTLEVRELLLRLRSLVRSLLPEAGEEIDWPARLISYAYGKKYSDVIVTLIPYKRHVNLGFYRAVDLPDETGLLEGTGKLHRHVKIMQPADIENPALAALIRAADEAKRKPEAGPAK
jgi:hypothetical protein